MDIPTSLRKDQHPYTRSSQPWVLSDSKAESNKLIHYISGGGLRAFGRTVQQEEVRTRQIRFLVFSLAFVFVWALLLIF